MQMTKVNDLPIDVKSYIRQGKSNLREEVDLLPCILPTGGNRTCLPPEHMIAVMTCTRQNMLTGGHPRANAIEQRFHWSECHQDVKDYANECHCKRTKRSPERKVGKMLTFEAKRMMIWLQLITFKC